MNEMVEFDNSQQAQAKGGVCVCVCVFALGNSREQQVKWSGTGTLRLKVLSIERITLVKLDEAEHGVQQKRQNGTAEHVVDRTYSGRQSGS